MKTSTVLLITGLSMVFIAHAPASAQVAPPPPTKPSSTPTYIRPDAAPVAPDIARNPTNVDDVVYVPLAQRDSDGLIIRLGMPADFAAMERNPLITDVTRAAIAQALDARRARISQQVIENASTMVEVDRGLLMTIEGIANNDEEGQLRLRAVQEMIRPLMVGSGLGEDLRDMGLLDVRQAAVNDKMSREYKGALLEEVRDHFTPQPGDPTSQVDLLLREAFGQQLEEPKWVYHQMLLKAADEITSAIRSLNLDSEQQGLIRAAVRAIPTMSTKTGKLNMMRDIMAELTPQQQRSMLEFASNLE